MKTQLHFILLFSISLFLSCGSNLLDGSFKKIKTMIPYSSDGKFYGKFNETPDYLDIVYYCLEDEVVDRFYSVDDFTNKSIKNNCLVGRVIAKQGDNLEIINGFAYVNGSRIDEELDLKFYYEFDERLSRQDQEYIQSLPLKEINVGPNVNRDKVILAALRNSQLVNLTSPYRKRKRRRGLLRVPVMTIPKGHFYLLVDFRNQVDPRDSRVFGPVPEGNIKIVEGR